MTTRRMIQTRQWVWRSIGGALILALAGLAAPAVTTAMTSEVIHVESDAPRTDQGMGLTPGGYTGGVPAPSSGGDGGGGGGGDSGTTVPTGGGSSSATVLSHLQEACINRGGTWDTYRAGGHRYYECLTVEDNGRYVYIIYNRDGIYVGACNNGLTLTDPDQCSFVRTPHP